MYFLRRIASLFRQRHPVLERNNALFHEFDQQKPLDRYEFVVFDTELTGLDARKDEIVSMGAVRIKGFRIMAGDNFHAYIKPGRPLPKDSTLIHRITPEQIQNAPGIQEVLPRFVEFCQGALLVGHYIDLDMAFVNRACLQHLGGTMLNPCIDTLRLAQVYKEEQWGNYYDQFNYSVSYNLGDLAREHGLPRFPEHDALDDAMQTAYLFLFLVRKLRQGGIRTLKDLYDAGRSWRWLF